MEKSEKITELFKALSVFHVKMDKVKKDAANPFFKSKYASLENILDAIREPLQESDLEFTQFPTGNYGLCTMLVHVPTGQYLQDCYNMEPQKKDPQGAGSVITYQRRYALTAILSINVESDDDGNRATHGDTKEMPKKITPIQPKPIIKKELLPNTPKWSEAIKFLATGTIQEVEKGYILSEDNRELLISQSTF